MTFPDAIGNKNGPHTILYSTKKPHERSNTKFKIANQWLEYEMVSVHLKRKRRWGRRDTRMSQRNTFSSKYATSISSYGMCSKKCLTGSNSYIGNFSSFIGMQQTNGYDGNGHI